MGLPSLHDPLFVTLPMAITFSSLHLSSIFTQNFVLLEVTLGSAAVLVQSAGSNISPESAYPSVHSCSDKVSYTGQSGELSIPPGNGTEFTVNPSCAR